MEQTNHITFTGFAPHGTERRIDLDWVRIGAFGLLIFYHVGMLYVSWGFHIKSAHRITALEPADAGAQSLAAVRCCSWFRGWRPGSCCGKYALGPLLRHDRCGC